MQLKSRPAVMVFFLCPSIAFADLRSDAEALIAQSFDEHLVFANCFHQAPSEQALIQGWMPDNLDRARPQLVEVGFTEAEIDALIVTAQFDQLLMPPETPYGEVRVFCAAHPEWSDDQRYNRHVYLSGDLQELIDAQ